MLISGSLVGVQIGSFYVPDHHMYCCELFDLSDPKIDPFSI